MGQSFLLVLFLIVPKVCLKTALPLPFLWMRFHWWLKLTEPSWWVGTRTDGKDSSVVNFLTYYLLFYIFNSSRSKFLYLSTIVCPFKDSCNKITEQTWWNNKYFFFGKRMDRWGEVIRHPMINQRLTTDMLILGKGLRSDLSMSHMDSDKIHDSSSYFELPRNLTSNE